MAVTNRRFLLPSGDGGDDVCGQSHRVATGPVADLGTILRTL